MNCRSCGANLPPGAAVCPVCGNPTPYNVAGAGSSQQYDPTVLSPKYGTPGGSNNPQQIDPTVAAPQYGTPGSPPPPSTDYGAPSYGTPPPPYQPPQDPYSQYPANQYAAPPPPNQYASPPMQQGGYVPPGSYAMQPPPPKPRRRIGLILGIVGAVLVVACLALCGIAYLVGKSTTTSSVKGPSGVYVDSTAAGYITNPQMSSAIDSNNSPTHPTTTFSVGAPIYTTFKLDSAAPDGYVEAKWYSNDKYIFSSDILHNKGGGVATGYVAGKYNVATRGAVELYWCGQSNCSDEKLAQVLTFSVLGTGMHWTGQPALSFIDINNREI